MSKPRPMSELRSVKAVIEEWDQAVPVLAALHGKVWAGVKAHLDQRERRIAEMLKDAESRQDGAT